MVRSLALEVVSEGGKRKKKNNCGYPYVKPDCKHDKGEADPACCSFESGSTYASDDIRCAAWKDRRLPGTRSAPPDVRGARAWELARGQVRMCTRVLHPAGSTGLFGGLVRQLGRGGAGEAFAAWGGGRGGADGASLGRGAPWQAFSLVYPLGEEAVLEQAVLRAPCR